MNKPHPAGAAPSRRFRKLAFTPLTLLAVASLASAQTDYTVSSIEVTQAVQDGSITLVAGRSTFVRATIAVSGPIQPVDGLMRIFVGGVESDLSPVFSENGPFPANGGMEADLDSTLNFAFVPPLAGGVTIEIEINPAGPNFVAETNTGNNTLTTAPLDFVFRRSPELAYSPIDYQFGAVPNPNLPNENLIKPGIGDGFIQGIYPGPTWFYHRTDAPSKLWTSSLSGSGSSLINSLEVDRLLMVPIPDYVYGWVAGSLPYNGQATIGGPASMGNTQQIRHQRTFAHEIGHNTGLSHNTTIINTTGVDVEHHLEDTQGLPKGKSAGLSDIMRAGLLTPEAWIGLNNYAFFLNHPSWNGVPLVSDEPTLIVSAEWNKETGDIELRDMVTVPNGTELSRPVPLEKANVYVRAFAGGEMTTLLPLYVESTLEDGGCGETKAAPNRVVPVTFAIPNGAGIDRVEIVDPAFPQRRVVNERSLRAPIANFTALEDGRLTQKQFRLDWAAGDDDGDELRYYLRYSNDGERFSPLATGTLDREFDIDLTDMPAPRDGKAFFELLVSDGLNTTQVRTAPLAVPTTFNAGIVGSAPWVEVMTPNDLSRPEEGATVILHCSGWDLEDRALSDASLVWESDVDGILGAGRRLTVNWLSAGGHTLTVTATDSDGNTATASARVFLFARGLPAVDTCQNSIPLAPVGDARMTLCGDALATGNTAALSIKGAPAGSIGFLVGGLDLNPTPLVGGLLGPFPSLFTKVIFTNLAGEVNINSVSGGGGPATLYLQYLYADPTQIEGWGTTNVLSVDILP